MVGLRALVGLQRGDAFLNWIARPQATGQAATGVMGLRAPVGLRRGDASRGVGCARARDEAGCDWGYGVSRTGGAATW